MIDPVNRPPLYIDLDGTLYPGDTLWESLVLLLCRQPLAAPQLLLKCLTGPASLKRWLSERILPDAVLLPYRPQVIDQCRRERHAGRRVVLATAAHHRIAHSVAKHLGCFDAVISTDRDNMKGHRKLLAIQQDARGPFWYAGDCAADLPIWKAASGAILVGPAAAWGPERVPTLVVARLPDGHNRILSFFKVLRPHQWVKNFLIFLPMLAAHRVSSGDDWRKAGLVFLAFCLCASSVYLVNDLMDIENDRAHTHKRSRPFAAGTMPLLSGLVAAPLLLVLAAAVAWLACPASALILTIYYFASFAYSLYLKTHVLLDVFVLTGLYGIRVIAGAVTVNVPLSPWLTAFTAFFFLSLALGKRAAELHSIRSQGEDVVKGRGWQADDLPFVTNAGIGSAFCAALVVGLYVTGITASTLYQRPEILWGTIPLILWWCTRIWLKASRGQLNEDPVLFALHDVGSWLAALLLLIVLFLAGPKGGL